MTQSAVMHLDSLQGTSTKGQRVGIVFGRPVASAVPPAPFILRPTPQGTGFVLVPQDLDDPNDSPSHSFGESMPLVKKVRYHHPFSRRLQALKTLDAINRQKARLRKELDLCHSRATEKRVAGIMLFLRRVQKRIEDRLMNERIADELFMTRYLHRRIPWEVIEESED